MTSEGDRFGFELSLRVVMYHEAIARVLGVTSSEHKLLDLVAQHADGISPGALASETGLSNAAITKLVSSLESAGYVSRQRNETDGRSVLVRLAPGYADGVRPSSRRLSRRIQELNSGFSPDEMAAVGRWLTGVIGALKVETEALEATSERKPVRR